MRAALALLLVLAARDATGKCAMPIETSTVITPGGGALAADGGIVVGATTTFDAALKVGVPDAINKTWRFSDGTKQYEPVMTTIAPGLVVYRPPAGVTGALTLVDGKMELNKATFTTDKPAQLAAPVAQTVRQVTVPERYGGTSLKLRAKFKAKPPEGVRALVVFGVTKAGNVARSWTEVDADATEHQVAGTTGRCDPGITGEIMSKPGDKIVLAWVDAHGRLSKLSKPIVVTKGK